MYLFGLLFVFAFGISGVPAAHHASKFCYKCHHATRLSECTEQEKCGVDQYCGAQVKEVEGALQFSLGCYDNHACEHAVFVGKRAHAHHDLKCNECCRDETCSNNQLCKKFDPDYIAQQNLGTCRDHEEDGFTCSLLGAQQHVCTDTSHVAHFIALQKCPKYCGMCGQTTAANVVTDKQTTATAQSSAAPDTVATAAPNDTVTAATGVVTAVVTGVVTTDTVTDVVTDRGTQSVIQPDTTVVQTTDSIVTAPPQTVVVQTTDSIVTAQPDTTAAPNTTDSIVTAPTPAGGVPTNPQPIVTVKPAADCVDIEHNGFECTSFDQFNFCTDPTSFAFSLAEEKCPKHCGFCTPDQQTTTGGIVTAAPFTTTTDANTALPSQAAFSTTSNTP